MPNQYINSQGSHYTDEDRRNAVTVWAVTGNLSEVERQLGIPNTTVSGWKRSDWWDEMLAEVRESIGEEMIARYQGIANKLLDRLEAAADKISPDRAAHSLYTVVQQLLLLSGKATSRTESVTIEKRISELSDNLRKLGRQDQGQDARVKH